MREYKEITRIGLLLSMIIHPIFLIAYGISLYELYTLCKFGRMNNNITILFICMVFFLAWFIILIIRIIRKPITIKEGILNRNKTFKITYTSIALIFIVSFGIFYGGKIYQSAINYNGKLSWFLKDLQNKRTVKFEDNNIYEDGIEGIFQDINKKIPMAEKLYISSNFDLKFEANGTITAFDTYLYGKNDKDELESYLISYNSTKSNKITIYLNGQVNEDFNEDKLLEPLMNTMKVIPLKETVSKWNDNQYGILYYGKRSFGYNTDGIVYVNSEGSTKSVERADSEIIGYAVSVFVPGKENMYTPARYIFAEDLNNIKVENSLKENDNKNTSKKESNGTDVFYLSEKVGYRLEVTDAAAGSRAYALEGTSDGGATWSLINGDPFLGDAGVAAGIVFLNDRLGFLCLSHSGGSNGKLYRTEDGGKSYIKINLPEIKVTLKGTETYNPFDFPGMPYEEGKSINILIGQGTDGDYNGGSNALYQSIDQGRTWEYVKEVAK